MKDFLKNVVISILTVEAKLVLWRFKPTIIAVTGSVGKTAAKDAIYSALVDSVHVRKNQKSYNSELGMPLTILGLDTGWNSMTAWAVNIIRGALVLFSKSYPDYLVLEAGVDRPGDMDMICDLITPTVAVFTSFGTTPVHVEYFEQLEDVWFEKMKLANGLADGGTIIYNQDDETVTSYCRELQHEKISFGSRDMSPDADVTFSDITYTCDGDMVRGQTAMIHSRDTQEQFSLDGAIGVTHMYPIVAAIAVSRALGIDRSLVWQSLRNHVPPRGRMNVLEGVRDTVLIDDTYNASPVAMMRAIDTLSAIPCAGRKVAVLGDMLELGSFSKDEHEKIGKYIAEKNVDVCITVGLRSKAILEQAEANGMTKTQLHSVMNATDVIPLLQTYLEPGDCILFKASQSIRLEKAVAAFLKNPQYASDLLVRQDVAWKDR